MTLTFLLGAAGLCVWPGYGRGGRQLFGLGLHRSQLHLLLEFHYVLAEEVVGIHEIFHRLAGVDHGGMITSAEVLADGLEGVLGKGFGQVHSDLSRLHDLALAGFLQ
jgi:hypothetical protein